MKYWQVDSFTSEAFRGNPAGVCILRESISNELQQKIAAEVNLSETAFVLLTGTEATIRWFTPRAEVNLCGHATLAAAHVLWQKGFLATDSITLMSKSGALTVTRVGPQSYSLNFPQQPPIPQSERIITMKKLLGCEEISFVGTNGEDCVAIVDSIEFLRQLQPNLEQIATLPERGLVASALSDSKDIHFEYRAFYPKLGIAEDPVTGSACTALGPYWSRILDRATLRAFQCSKRGGKLDLSLEGERVLIEGEAVTVMEGEFSPHIF